MHASFRRFLERLEYLDLAPGGPRRAPDGVDPEVAHAPSTGSRARSRRSGRPRRRRVQLVELRAWRPAGGRARRPCAARPAGSGRRRGRSSEMSYWAPVDLDPSARRPRGVPVRSDEPVDCVPGEPFGRGRGGGGFPSARFMRRARIGADRGREGSLEQSTGVLAVPHRRLAHVRRPCPRSTGASRRRPRTSRPASSAASRPRWPLWRWTRSARQLSHQHGLGGRRGQLVVGDVLWQRELEPGDHPRADEVHLRVIEHNAIDSRAGSIRARFEPCGHEEAK